MRNATVSKKSKSTNDQKPANRKNGAVANSVDRAPLILAAPKPDDPRRAKYDLIIPYLQAGYLPPIMTKGELSQLTGIPLGIVTNWVNRGQIPTIKIGKHRIINGIALLIMLDSDFA